MSRLGGIGQRGNLGMAIAVSTAVAIAAIFVDVYGLQDGWHWGLALPAGVVVISGLFTWWRNARRATTRKQLSS